MNDKLKALAQKWRDGWHGPASNGFFSPMGSNPRPTLNSCADELDALAATLTPLGDKDGEAVAVLRQHADDVAYDDFASGIARKEDRAIVQRVAYNEAVEYIATRLAESGGGEVDQKDAFIVPEGNWYAERRGKALTLTPATPPTPSAAVSEAAEVLRWFADRVRQAEPWLHKGAKFTRWAKDLAADLDSAALAAVAEKDAK